MTQKPRGHCGSASSQSFAAQCEEKEGDPIRAGSDGDVDDGHGGLLVSSSDIDSRGDRNPRWRLQNATLTPLIEFRIMFVGR